VENNAHFESVKNEVRKCHVEPWSRNLKYFIELKDMTAREGREFEKMGGNS